ncbi:MAG: FAD-dependent oxidoreductase, partial [Clostridiales bacterium]|nr:FAD-dependent oxidoreductase [Clostridiales bacterium]
AAVAASARGHEVTLVERQNALGGTLRFTDKDTHKTDLNRYKNYLIGCVNRTNVNVVLGAEVTDEIVESLRPDAIIVATGAKPIIPFSIKGIEAAHPAIEEYINTELKLSDELVIIGSGLVSMAEAIHLASLGKSVTVLEMADDFAVEASDLYGAAIRKEVHDRGIEVVTGAKATEVTSDGVKYTKGGAECFAKGGTVFYAVGMHKDERVYFDLYDKAPAVYIIGDCADVGKVDGAVHSGFFAAMDIGDL